MKELKNDGQVLASLLSETVARQLVFILITVDDELNRVHRVRDAQRAWPGADDDGSAEELSVFPSACLPLTWEALQRRWQQLIATVGQEHFPKFLRYHLLCEQPKVRSQRLFKLVRDQTKTSADVFALMEQLEDALNCSQQFQIQSRILDRIVRREGRISGNSICFAYNR